MTYATGRAEILRDMAAFPGRRPLIERAKLTDYLLSASHPKGRSKARYFAAAGYRADNWMRLRDDLLTAIEDAPPMPGIAGAHGVKYKAPYSSSVRTDASFG